MNSPTGSGGSQDLAGRSDGRRRRVLEEWTIGLAPEELLNDFVRVLPEVFGILHGEAFPLEKEGDAVRNGEGAFQIVSDRDAGDAQRRFQVHDDPTDDIGHDGIQAGSGLIEKENLGLERNGPCKPDPPFHAPGQRRGPLQLGPLESHHIETLLHAIGDLRWRQMGMPLEGEGDIFSHRHGIKERSHLKAHAHLLALLEKLSPAQVLDDLPIDGHMPDFRSHQANNAAQQHRLTGAAPTEDHHAFALLHGKVDIGKDCPGTEGLGQLDDFNDRHISPRKEGLS